MFLERVFAAFNASYHQFKYGFELRTIVISWYPWSNAPLIKDVSPCMTGANWLAGLEKLEKARVSETLE